MHERSQYLETLAGEVDLKLDPTDAWLEVVDLGVALPTRERALYARYVRALALLCECAPYVDDEDYADLIDDLLADACRHYPLSWHRDGECRQIAVRPAEHD